MSFGRGDSLSRPYHLGGGGTDGDRMFGGLGGYTGLIFLGSILPDTGSFLVCRGDSRISPPMTIQKNTQNAGIQILIQAIN